MGTALDPRPPAAAHRSRLTAAIRTMALELRAFRHEVDRADRVAIVRVVAREVLTHADVDLLRDALGVGGA